VNRSRGPWYVSPVKRKGVSDVPVTVVVDVDESPVANCGSGSLGEANAQLIACAPSLLAVVRSAYWEVYDLPEEGQSKWVRDAEDLLRHLGELS
jgi:hypothetical protein